MKARYIIIPLLIIIIGLFSYLVFCGLFYEVEVKESVKGPFVLVYEKHIGPYDETGEIQRDLYESLLLNEEVQTFKVFTINYDNPGEIDKSKLRSITGCILEKRYYDKIEVLKKNFSIGMMPESKYVYTEFPFIDNPSITLAHIKTNPKLKRFLKQRGYERIPQMVIYDFINWKIKFLYGAKLDKKIYDSFLK